MSGVTPEAASELFRTAPARMLDMGNGAAVAYRRVGSGPDVLFVHGWPVSGATFRTLLPHLAHHVTCHVIDLPGAGSSRFGPDSVISIAEHIRSVGRVLDLLALESVALVGHDSGGLIARHAMAGDPRLRALGLINTEQVQGLSWRFRQLLLARRLPGFPSALGWALAAPRLRRNSFVVGGAFVDLSLIDGEFDEFFLKPIHHDRDRRRAAVELLASFDLKLVRDLADVHAQINVPVRLVWGAQDPFFPVAWAAGMVATFPQADLTVIDDAKLFVHEERPAQVASALLPVLTALD